MKFIFTKEDKKIVRKTIDGYRQSYIIDAREIILEFDYIDVPVINSSQDFIINKELEKKLHQSLLNKKSQQVIYFHYLLSSNLVKNIKSFFKEHGIKPEYIIFDPDKSHKKIWHLFDEVLI